MYICCSLKKIAVIFTFVFIIILSTGSFFVFSNFISQYQTDYQAYIQKEKSKINTSEILINPSQLYINSAKISWEDDNKELVVDGVLYDIVSFAVNNKGKLVITVLSDNQEQEFKKEFASNYDVCSSKKSNNPIKLLKQFLALKFINQDNDDSYLSVNSSLHSNYTEFQFSIKSVFLSQETPPPSLLA